MGPRVGVFCHNGLGDGVVTLVLPNNLHLNGWQVQIYQNTMGSMQNWFPHLPVQPYPSPEEVPSILNSYDWFFVVQDNSSPFVIRLIEEGKRRFPEKIKVIYLYPSRHIVNERYYSDCPTDPTQPIAENMYLFCEKTLHLPKLTRSNGFIPPEGLHHRKHPQRVVIHPTSASVPRNWPKPKFLELAKHLKAQGYEVVFVPGAPNVAEWEDAREMGFKTPVFSTLDALARFIYESGYLIGNDSGLGHLASALNIPTMTFCRRKAWAAMWAPSFRKGIVVTPSSWIPNIRGLRLRDRYWRKFITVGMAKKAFDRLKIS